MNVRGEFHLSTIQGMNEKPSMHLGKIDYNHKLAPLLIRSSLLSIIPDEISHIYVLGIGSNQINGDSLGPLVGTLLNDLYPNHLTVIGNLKSPLDATTIEEEITKMNFSKNSFVVAIDSVLGRKDMVNTIVVKNGALTPGIGLGNHLPSIGDCSVMGVVLENDPVLHSSLLYTNLHIIFTMATNIARGISIAVRQIFKYPAQDPVLLLK
jgi:putative sporulation protein YyaC